MRSELVDNQISEDDWRSPVLEMLHERRQPKFSGDLGQQFSDLEDIARQMELHESEFLDVLAILKRKFIFTDPDGIEGFLKAHRILSEVLLEGLPYFKECFGESTPLALEIMSDEGPPNAIYALALWAGTRTDARKALAGFDELWWLANIGKTGGRIVFDYELV